MRRSAPDQRVAHLLPRIEQTERLEGPEAPIQQLARFCLAIIRRLKTMHYEYESLIGTVRNVGYRFVPPPKDHKDRERSPEPQPAS